MHSTEEGYAHGWSNANNVNHQQNLTGFLSAFSVDRHAIPSLRVEAEFVH